MMNHYKSWAALNGRLQGFLCEELQGRVSYFLTRYHKVHNAYGRAAIRLDGKELVCFTWMDGYKQEFDRERVWKETGGWEQDNPELKEKWDQSGTYSEMDFLDAATAYLGLPAAQALASGNYLVKVFAIMDRRLGKRTLQSIAKKGAYLSYPAWVRQFYALRLSLLER